MKNPLDVLKNLKRVILDSEVKLAERTTEEGTVYTAESFEVGQVMYLDGQPVDAGSYSFPDGESIETDGDGVIVQVSKPDTATEAEAEAEVEATTEVEVEASEQEVEAEVEVTPEVETEASEVITLAQINDTVDAKVKEMEVSLVNVITDLVKELNAKIEDTNKKVELASTEAPSREEQPSFIEKPLTSGERRLQQFYQRTQN